ncbi:hypothetical protein TNCV_2122371 [Trichonephila clavipes]|nr:hypothetical protein TNCV_2122371 [Trichonephila clavipes]
MTTKLHPKTVQTQATIKKMVSDPKGKSTDSKIHCIETRNVFRYCNYKIILENLNDEAHFWLNGYVNKQNCRIWSEANPLVYVETPLHPEKLTVWCALWAGGNPSSKR